MGGLLLIKRKDVVRLKVPFPNIASALAVNAHMYICREKSGTTYKFVKCQTLKPYMLTSNTMTHYWDEQPDITRNPFSNPTRIDCDKEFVTSNVTYDDRLKTTLRPDVCDDVIDHVEAELFSDGYQVERINEAELKTLNHYVVDV